jgi:TDG/mug DNA glycosylase family protein
MNYGAPDLLHDFGLVVADGADGPLVNSDLVRQDARVVRGPVRQRDSFVEAKQTARPGTVLDEDSHVLHQVGKLTRQRVQRGPDHSLERLRVNLDHSSILGQLSRLRCARTLGRVNVPLRSEDLVSPVGLRRPTQAEIAAARGRSIPDLVAPGLRVLFAGINPSLYSAATGYHFARPGNRFWPALHQSGFTSRQLRPEEQPQLLGLGLGITNVVAQATARADELSATELRAGGQALAELAGSLGVSFLAILGVTAYRTAFGVPKAVVGSQEGRLGGARVWILPNPSGLNASWPMPRLAEAFRELADTAYGGVLAR